MASTEDQRAQTGQTGHGSTQRPVQDDEISLIDLYITMLRRWRVMAVVFLLVVGTTVMYAFYQQTATQPEPTDTEEAVEEKIDTEKTTKKKETEKRITEIKSRLEHVDRAVHKLEARLTELPDDAGIADVAGSVWLYESLLDQRKELKTAWEQARQDLEDLEEEGLIIMLGIVLGGMLAIFSAFITEFMVTAHQEYRRRVKLE
ncbi:hypothetical protein LRD18_10655 [Halorhodospira halochloris]|uniref:hypothetical protein n=1 Tax=Halorhodospira halochloris TaxID=1052 RepID=UPI001EE7DB9A|nr:hypothetical protein [Halorhodospira halochloris]MCG5531310.1 hypothetical protein [Halorhodospira halochloris]